MLELEARSSEIQWIARFLFCGAVALTVYLQAVGLKLRRAERRAWWAGNGRDLLNAVGAGLLMCALRLMGFPWPPTILWAATLMLVLFGFYVFMEVRVRSRRPTFWTLLSGAVVTAPVMLWPRYFVALFYAAARALFPS